jgi:pimeloyl-ACP methyl ester carboxylesterase
MSFFLDEEARRKILKAKRISLMTKDIRKFFTVQPTAIVGLIILIVGVATPSILYQQSMAQLQLQQNRGGLSHQITTSGNLTTITTILPSYSNSTFTHHLASVNGGVILHYVIGGHGNPVVLLAGWPETWYAWRHVMPALARNYTVIAPDMRGLGDSSKPVTGYDVRTVAEDIHQLVSQLGFKRILLVGHDWGGEVAYAYAAAHLQDVRRLVILEVPILLSNSTANLPWWFPFFQTRDIPEELVAGKEQIFLTWFYRNLAYNPAAITDTDINVYVSHYSAPGGMRAGFEYYRAFLDDVAEIKEYAKTKLPMPVLALGGDHNFGMLPLTSMQSVATNVRGGVVPMAGHWLPEERPDYVVGQLLSFFGQEK